jgi:methionyl aminopeptidase
MRILLKSMDEIRLMREAGLVVSGILDEVCAMVAPGVSTWELDRKAAQLIEKHRVTSAFLGYYGYPAVLCTSINEVVVHGIPRKEHILKDGDIIGIDFGIFREGFCADSARTILCGDVIESTRKLVDVTRESLDLAISHCRAGNRLGDVGAAVQNHAEKHGYSVVKTFVGHGIGTKMHEDPPVPNYGVPSGGKRMKHGLVIAVEPMVNAGASDVEVLDDEWTAVTKDKSLSGHFEHTIAILDDGPWVLTRASSRPGDPGRD